MAKAKNKPVSNRQGQEMKTYIQKYCNVKYFNKLLFDPNCTAPICWLLLLAEVFLNVLIIERVSYTEIDWRAYMQEVGGFLNGTLDYRELKGDTGPCVYPAGFIYIYSAFYFITNQGENIRLAQYIFLTIYLAQVYLTYDIYKKTCKIPGYALILSALTSYRIHSIYVLRLFNDPIAVLLFYFSLNMFLSGRWTMGSVFYSLAVSVKMNILLFAPCLLMAYLINLSYKKTFVNLTICAVIQLILGLPFILHNPISYIKASFDLGRIFEHKWTVNYRFLPREIFEDKAFHITLLVLHLSLLGLFYKPVKRYFNSYKTLRTAIVDMKTQSVKKVKEEKEEPLTKEQQQFLDAFEKQIAPKNRKAKPKVIETKEEEKYQINFNKIAQLFVLPFFVTNFIGILCSRSLHYQFYSWYFHSLLYLGFSTQYKKRFIFLMLGVLEYSWNVYPSTILSSSLLHIVHIVMLIGVYRTMSA